MITEKDCVNAIEEFLTEEFDGSGRMQISRYYDIIHIDMWYGPHESECTTLAVELLDAHIQMCPPGPERHLVHVPLAHPQAFEILAKGVRDFQGELLAKGVKAVWPHCPPHLL